MRPQSDREGSDPDRDGDEIGPARPTAVVENPEANLVGRMVRDRRMPFYVAPILLALSVVALFFFYYPFSFESAFQSLTASIIKTAITFAILGIGASLVIATSQIDLSSIGVATISGLLFAITLSHGPPSPTLTSIALATIVPLIFGALSGALVAVCFSRLRAPLLIFTWALGAVYTVTAILLTRLASKTSLADVSGVGLPAIPLNFWHFGHTGFNTAIAVLIATLVIIYSIQIPQRAVAVGASELSAQYAGIDNQQTYTRCFIANGMLASIAGIFHSLYLGQAATTDLGGRELIPIAIAVLGGTSLAGGYLKMPSVIAAALFWSVMRLLGPHLPSLFPPLRTVQAELGQILFFSIFILVSLLFGRLLAPPVPKVFAQREP